MLNDNLSQSATIWGITIAILFFIMVIGMYRSFKFSSESRKQAKQRIRSLYLGDMLDRLGIPLGRYLRKTSDLEKERHTWVCEHCPNPDSCERMLRGENIDPLTFCPNYSELKHLDPKLQNISPSINPDINRDISRAH